MKKAVAFFSIFLLISLIALPVLAEEANTPATNSAQTGDSTAKKSGISSTAWIIGGVVIIAVVVASSGGSSSSAPAAQGPTNGTGFPDNPPNTPPTPQAFAGIDIGKILRSGTSIIIGRTPIQGETLCAIVPLGESKDTSARTNLSISSNKIAVIYGFEF